MLRKVMVNFLSVLVLSYALPGVHIDSLGATLAIGAVLTVLNTILTPLLKLLAFPITLMTLGLFSCIINACVLALAFGIVGGHIDSIFVTLIFSIILGLLNAIFEKK